MNKLYIVSRLTTLLLVTTGMATVSYGVDRIFVHKVWAAGYLAIALGAVSVGVSTYYTYLLRKEKPMCEKCGGKNLMSTTKGTLCKTCGHMQGSGLENHPNKGD